MQAVRYFLVFRVLLPILRFLSGGMWQCMLLSLIREVSTRVQIVFHGITVSKYVQGKNTGFFPGKGG